MAHQKADGASAPRSNSKISVAQTRIRPYRMARLHEARITVAKVCLDAPHSTVEAKHTTVERALGAVAAKATRAVLRNTTTPGMVTLG